MERESEEGNDDRDDWSKEQQIAQRREKVRGASQAL